MSELSALAGSEGYGARDNEAGSRGKAPGGPIAQNTAGYYLVSAESTAKRFIRAKKDLLKEERGPRQ